MGEESQPSVVVATAIARTVESFLNYLRKQFPDAPPPVLLFENALLEPLKPLRPISLGHEHPLVEYGIATGAPRVTAERWTNLLEIALVAALIVMIPGHTAGVRQEIEFIRERELWSKTLFVQPHLEESEWEDRQRTLAGLIELPPFRDLVGFECVLFVTDEEGKRVDEVVCDAERPATVEEAVRRLRPLCWARRFGRRRS